MRPGQGRIEEWSQNDIDIVEVDALRPDLDEVPRFSDDKNPGSFPVCSSFQEGFDGAIRIAAKRMCYGRRRNQSTLDGGQLDLGLSVFSPRRVY
jgi:hypothetical protein